MHIIFGWKDPKQKAPRLRKKRDFYYSESNYNLFVEEGADVTLGRFIKTLEGGRPWLQNDDPVHIVEEGFSLCKTCQGLTKVQCALFQNPDAEPPPDTSIKKLAKTLLWWPPGSSEPLRWCAIVQRLRDMTETPAEGRFYDLYICGAVQTSLLRAQRVLERAYGGELVAELREHGIGAVELGDRDWSFFVHEELLDELGSPALIPQVVLNFVLTRDLPEDHPDKRFFESNEGRVDFFFLDSRGKHIIHIDGPYHHRTEEEYTRVLRRDRTMRRQGYLVHRFSNMEVRQAKDFHAFAWELFH